MKGEVLPVVFCLLYAFGSNRRAAVGMLIVAYLSLSMSFRMGEGRGRVRRFAGEDLLKSIIDGPILVTARVGPSGKECKCESTELGCR